MNAVERTNVMIMQHARIHLVATPVTAILDTVEMEETVQVCAEYNIRESVDSLCRDDADMPMPPYIRKAYNRPNAAFVSLFR